MSLVSLRMVESRVDAGVVHQHFDRTDLLLDLVDDRL